MEAPTGQMGLAQPADCGFVQIHLNKCLFFLVFQERNVGEVNVVCECVSVCVLQSTRMVKGGYFWKVRTFWLCSHKLGELFYLR